MKKDDNRFNFTQARVKNLSAATGKDYYTRYDVEVPKLCVRVYPTGNKVFYVLKKPPTGGRLKPVRLDSFSDMNVDQARERAIDVIAQISKGVDPNEEKQKRKAQSLTLEQLFEEYLESKKQKLKPLTVKDYRQKMRWGFSDWMNKPASMITKQMVLSRYKKLSVRPTACNGAFRPLRAVLNHAVATEALEDNPVSILSAQKLWHKGKRRTDTIRSEQLGEWLAAVDRLEPAMHRLAFKMMLFMGYRITETYSIEWSDVDLVNGLIVQRDTKNNTDHELPIPGVLLPLIADWRGELEEGLGQGEKMPQYMFPAVKRDTFHGRPKRQIAALNEALSFEFRPHTARHTFTTIAEAVGVPKTMIDRLTNHTMDSDVTAGYIHAELGTLREAINKVAAYIQAQVDADNKVVKLYG